MSSCGCMDRSSPSRLVVASITARQRQNQQQSQQQNQQQEKKLQSLPPDDMYFGLPV